MGYDKAAEVAKKAERDNTTVFEAALKMKLLPEGELKRLMKNHYPTRVICSENSR